MSNSIAPTSRGHVNHAQPNAPTSPAGAEQEGALHGVPVINIPQNITEGQEVPDGYRTPPSTRRSLEEIYDRNAANMTARRAEELGRRNKKEVESRGDLEEPVKNPLKKHKPDDEDKGGAGMAVSNITIPNNNDAITAS